MQQLGKWRDFVLVGASFVCFASTVDAQETPWEAYGFLNFGILDYDDGRESSSFLVDNSNAPSRIGINYRFPAGEGDLRFNFETALGIVSSSSVDLVEGSGDAFDFDKTSLRKFEVIYSSDAFGRISFGQGSMATDGAAGADYSGTTIVTTSAISDLAGGNLLRDEAGALTDVRVGDTNGNLDGSRRFRLRYDTSRYSGFGVSAAYGQEVLRDNDDNDYYDVALSYSSSSDYIDAEAYLGYSWAGNDREWLVGSVAVLHSPTGLNGAIAAGREDSGGSYYWLKAGIRRDWFSMGETALSLDYYVGEDFESEGSDTDSWAIALVQKIDSANLETFLVYREYGFSELTTDYLDGRGIMVGGRWRF